MIGLLLIQLNSAQLVEGKLFKPQKIELSLMTKAPSQQTQLSSMKLKEIISYGHLNIKKYLGVSYE